MCPNCRAFITTDDRVCPYCNQEAGLRAAERRLTADALGGLIPHARFTTMMIILINAGFYIATVLYSMRASPQGSAMDLDGPTLFAFGAKFGPAIAQGQWWRLITAGFLHGGLLHIGMNIVGAVRHRRPGGTGLRHQPVSGDLSGLQHHGIHGEHLLGPRDSLDRRFGCDFRIDRRDDRVRHSRSRHRCRRCAACI